MQRRNDIIVLVGPIAIQCAEDVCYAKQIGFTMDIDGPYLGWKR